MVTCISPAAVQVLFQDARWSAHLPDDASHLYLTPPVDRHGISALMAKSLTFHSETVDSSYLTDADWGEINKLKRAFKDGGNALGRELINSQGRTTRESPLCPESRQANSGRVKV
jgi:hypothetical protein